MTNCQKSWGILIKLLIKELRIRLGSKWKKESISGALSMFINQAFVQEFRALCVEAAKLSFLNKIYER